MRSMLIQLGLLAGVIALSGCGGGGGPGSTVEPIPNPPPTPPPPPPPPPPPAGAYLTPGIQQSTTFAALGWEVDANDSTISDLATSGFAVSYNATTQTYSVALPSYAGAPPSTFTRGGENSSTYFGTINGSGMQPASVSILKPGDFQYTNLVSVDLMSAAPNSVFAFGLATQPGQVPVTGSATYLANVLGTTFGNAYYFTGNARFNFDFAAGTLGGDLSLYISDLGGGTDSLGTYSFINTIYGTGSTTFSGQLRNNSNGLSGGFDGQFTGPGAEELMARWNANFINPDTQTTQTAVGALIGRRPGP